MTNAAPRKRGGFVCRVAAVSAGPSGLSAPSPPAALKKPLDLRGRFIQSGQRLGEKVTRSGDSLAMSTVDHRLHRALERLRGPVLGAFSAALAIIAASESPADAVETMFVRGDSNADGEIDISDGVAVLQYLFLGEAAGPCLAAKNVNGDSDLDISDAVALLSFLFLGAAPPAAPYPDCGVAPPSEIGPPCGSFPPCQPPGGEVHGSIYFQVGSGGTPATGARQIFLPDVTAHLKDPSTGREGPRVTTDAKGRFEIPRQQPGTYELHVDGPGFAPGLDPKPVVIENQTVYRVPSRILPASGLGEAGFAVWGKVSLADGTPARYRDAFFDVDSVASVAVLDAVGEPVRPPVRVNSLGEFVLPVSRSPAGLSLMVTYEVVSATQPLAAGAGEADLKLPNSSPAIRSLFATMAGQGVRLAAPGAVVTVEAEAEDPDGDHLAFEWRAASGEIVPLAGAARSGQSMARWTLPQVKGLMTAYVLARDGKGGYAFRRLDLSTEEGVPFAGEAVERDGLPVHDAVASVATAGPTRLPLVQSTRTDESGSFFLLFSLDSSRYVLNVSKPGYKLRSRVLSGRTVGARYRMDRAARFPVDPRKDIVVSDSSGAKVEIPAFSLADASGTPAVSSLFIDLATFDPADPEGDLPGDGSAVDALGTAVALESSGAIEVEVHDDAGNRYGLSPGTTATVSIPIDPRRLATPGAVEPAEASLWSYDQNAGLWREEGKAARDGSVHRASVGRLGIHGAGEAFANPACLRLALDRTRFSLPIVLRITAPTGAGASPAGSSVSRVFTQPIDGAADVTVIRNLPPHRTIQIEALDPQGDGKPLGVLLVDSGEAVADLDPAYPFRECTTGVDWDLTLDVARQGVLVPFCLPFRPADSGFLDWIGLSTQAEAADYYSRIDPTNARLTLSAWKAANGFNPNNDSGDDALAVYFNRGDLGFGRRMHFKRQPTGARGSMEYAYYVSNHPTVDEARLDLNRIASVAMEYSRRPVLCNNIVGHRYTKFYVYNGSGNRVPSVDLDGRGQKYLPKLCIICHAGNTASMNCEGDVGARFVPFALDSFLYSTTPGYTRADQEGAFKLMNQMLLNTNAAQATTEVVQGWYAGNASVQNSAFIPQGWMSAADVQNLYTHVVKPSCRPCHVTRDSPIDWANFNSGFLPYGSYIHYITCTGRQMPNALKTYDQFWLSWFPNRPCLLKQVMISHGGWNATDTCP